MRRLLIRPGAIGDCILSFPALRHLASAYTEIWISRPVVPLIDFADVVRPLAATGLDRVGLGEERMESRLDQHFRSFDSIVSWYGSNRPEFREAMEGLGVPCTFHRALPPDDFEGHATDFFAKQAGAPPGLVPRIQVPKGGRRGTVVVHPFSGGRKKNWPLENYRALLKQIDRQAEWTAGPEEELAEATRFADLDKLAAWLSGADLYVGNDSGITHLAAATGVRTVALFGPSSPRTWGPRGENVRILHHDPPEQLTVETVAAAISELLG